MPTANFKVEEILQKRTTNSKTWLNFDGSFTTEIFPNPVHFEDQHGNLQNLNTDLYDEADFDIIDEPVAAEGVERFNQAKIEAQAAKKKNVLNRSQHNLQALRVPFDAHIPRNFQRGYTIGKGQDKLTFKPVKSSPSMGELSQADRSIIVYQDVWNDTDVELKIQPDGIKETLYLKTEKAPSSFSFEVKGKEIAADFTAGALKLMPAWLIDAAGTYRDVEQKIVKGNDNKVYVEVMAPVDGLVYPVVIDPTVTLNYSNILTDGYTSSDASYKFYNTEDVMVVGGSGSSRSYLKFDLSGIPANSAVLSATLGLFIPITGSGATGTVYVNRVTQEPGSITHANPAVFTTTGRASLGIDGSEYNVAKSVNVKAMMEDMLANNYGFWLTPDSGVKASFSTSRDTLEGRRPTLSVSYNVPPGRPNIISPNGGESLNAQHVISWEASTDNEGDSLLYQVDLSIDNGTTWKVIAAQVSGTTFEYDFSNEAETSLAALRVRSFDGVSYSDWDESSGVFTIDHNDAPYTPMNLVPNGGAVKDRGKAVRLSWLHNDPDGTDPQSKYDLQWRKKGSNTWAATSQVSVNQYHDLTNLEYGQHEWRVRTYDQDGLSSPYSDIALFLAGDKPPAATIVNPTDGAAVSVANPTVQWSSITQSVYKLVVKDPTGVIVWTDEKVSTNKAVTIGTDLQNQKAYTLEVTIKNADGLWSDAVQITINVSYTPPALPTLSAVGQNQAAAIRLSIGAPSPSGTEPPVTHHDVYRRKQGETNWIRIEMGAPVNGIYVDATPGSGHFYEYFVRAWGDNGTFRDSPTVRSSVTLRSIWLMDPQEPWSLHRFHYFEPGRSAERVFNGSLMEFEGRTQFMAEFSEREQNKVNVILQLKKDSDDLAMLHELLGRRTTLLYRDAKGRRIFGVAFSLTENETDYGYTVPLEVQAVDYKEEV